MRACKYFSGPCACEKRKISRRMTHLRVYLTAASNLRVAVGPFARIHVRRTMSRLGPIAAKEVADWIGHQHTDHAYFAQVSVTYQSLSLSSVHRVMPWAADQKLGSLSLCGLYQILSLSDRQRHRLFDQHVLAQCQSRRRMFVMKMWAATDHVRLKAVNGEELGGAGARDRNAEVIGNLLRLRSISFLNGDQLCVWMTEQSWNMSKSRPPSCADESALNPVLHKALLYVWKSMGTSSSRLSSTPNPGLVPRLTCPFTGRGSPMMASKMGRTPVPSPTDRYSANGEFKFDSTK